ncbi:MAG: hypothetical protein ACR2KB_06185 [Chitinophagaceae bacterium]
MKKILMTGSMLVSIFVYSQDKLFKVYTDSAFLVNDANKIVDDFVDKVNAISPVFTTKPLAILNTKPYLIFYSPKANQVNLPIWHQVMPQQKEFFTNIAGSEKEGEKVFALFFNGFYLSHELGHALQNAANMKKYCNSDGWSDIYTYILEVRLFDQAHFNGGLHPLNFTSSNKEIEFTI